MFIGYLQRPVGSGEGQPREKGRAVLAVVLYVLDDPIGVEGGGIKVFGQCFDFFAVIQIDGPRIGIQHSLLVREVACTPLHQGKGFLKSSLVRPRARGCSNVPLSCHIGVITRIAQQRGHGDHILAQVPLKSRLTPLVDGQVLCHRAETCKVSVHAGEHHGPGRGTGRRRVEVGHGKPRTCQGIDVRRPYLTAEGSDVGVAQVVSHYQKNVWPFVPRPRTLILPDGLILARRARGHRHAHDQYQT